MNYFIITGTEHGIEIQQFDSHSLVVKHLNDFYTDTKVMFLSTVPKDMYDFYNLTERKVLVISGEVVIPKSVTITKEYELE